ncbi:GNAT family N-acetyltransferase [Streptomyces lasiicapitis]|uniref:GNAT family N-acetyltransferase n=1 Tax=Streptomyces lasiicapitis TaxID=1923961 RepID=UPI00369419AF
MAAESADTTQSTDVTDVAELVRIWAAGWAVSRRTPRPAELPWGVYVEVGKPDQAGRHVLPEPSAAVVRAAAASVTAPYTWLKVPVEPLDAEPWLPEGWVVDKEECGYLMAVGLRPAEPVAPDGYTASVETDDGVTFVRVHDGAGQLAAQGQMAVLGHATVVDRVVTQEAHRRRGLGGFVMRTLTDEALARGAAIGVLGATPDGRALYETLGWHLSAPLAACVYRP